MSDRAWTGPRSIEPKGASDLRIFPDAHSLARAAAEAVAAAAADAIRARGWFDLGLSGGRTPGRAYRRLAEPDLGIDWSRARLWFADERAVPPTDPDSNFRLALETLIEPARVPMANVHRMRAEQLDLAAVAAEYEVLLTGPLDVLVLGVGEDGHTASIFPGSPLVDERQRRVAAVFDSPKPPSRRLTVTPRVIEETRQVLVLATGEDKAAAVAGALVGASDPHRVPACLLRGRTWLIDQAASGAVGGRPA
ncbi:MAG TPA: 6-phosphogluconolactonase [Candidatus Eisenbacteria bacterium]